MSRRMIVLDVARRRFPMRAAAIIRRDGHVLIHRATHELIEPLASGGAFRHLIVRQTEELVQ